MGKEFQNEFHRKFRSKPTAWSALGFDSAWLMIEAIKKSGQKPSGEKIKGELEKIRDLELVTQRRFSFSPGRSPLGGLPVYRIDQSGIKLLGGR